MAETAMDPYRQGVPLSTTEVEGLVKSLYSPGSAKKIPEIEATLRIIQRSPQGWEVGDALLSSDDEQVRFFGALTFTIKLNADSSQLTEQESEQVLVKLIHHLIIRPTPSAATRKLCSTLAQYFTKSSSSWEESILSLVISFTSQRPALDEALTNQPSLWDVLPQLPDATLFILLDFAMNLAEEVKKLPTNVE